METDANQTTPKYVGHQPDDCRACERGYRDGSGGWWCCGVEKLRDERSQTTGHWLFRRHPRFRYSPAAILVSLAYGVGVGIAVATSSWNDLREVFGTVIAFLAAGWFLKTYCKEYDND